jgi:hypothetical protein
MAQVSDVNLANQGFSAFRTELNNILAAVNTSHLGSSAPASVAADILKFYDGAQHINLGTINTTANTVDWTDSVVTADLSTDTSPQLGGDLDILARGITSSNTIMNSTLSGTGKSLVFGF